MVGTIRPSRNSMDRDLGGLRVRHARTALRPIRVAA